MQVYQIRSLRCNVSFIAAILYERLIEVDGCDFLFSPFGAASVVLELAESKGVPIINIGIFEYDTVTFFC